MILFSHPADFTPVCTTEFMSFAMMQDDLKKMNCDLIGLSIDSLYSHIAWLRLIETMEWKKFKGLKVEFPLIADITMEVAKKFGMMQPNASATSAVRAVFFIDPEGTVRTILYYPLSTGRNFDEIKRILQSLQTVDKNDCATPADWRPGDDVIIPTAGSMKAAEKIMNDSGDGQYCLDWFLCFKKDKGI